MANVVFTDQQSLIVGSLPVETISCIVKASSNLSKNTIVMFDANGKVVAWDGTAGKAAGILAQDVPTEVSSVDSKNVMYISGTFNANLVFAPASANTIALKRAAFTSGITLKEVYN